MENQIEEIRIRKRSVIDAAQKELGGIIAGSFFRRQIKGYTRHCLSVMRNGKQRQMYVSAKDSKLMELGTLRYARLMVLLHELSELNLTLTKNGVDLNV